MTWQLFWEEMGRVDERQERFDFNQSMTVFFQTLELYHKQRVKNY